MPDDTPDMLDVCAVDDVPTGLPRRVEVDGEGILVCRGADGIYAVSEICPHKYESMAWGIVMGHTIICPHHQYGFDLRTGACDKRKCPPVDTRTVQVREGRVFVARRVPVA